jgi:Flp pilus assembly protein CpaB
MTGTEATKYLTGVVIVAFFGVSAPLHAQVQQPPAQSEAAAPVQPAKPAKKVAAAKKRKPAPADSASFDGTASTDAWNAKKAASDPTRHTGTVPVVREGGKTCSGQDEYRVCW